MDPWSKLFGFYTAAEAEADLRKQFERHLAKLGPNHEDTISAEWNLTSFLFQENRHGEAEPHLRHLLMYQQRILGAEHIDTLTTAAHLGMSLCSMQQYEESETVIRTTLDQLQKTRPLDDLLTIECVSSLRVLLRFTGRYDEGACMLRRAIDFHSKDLGADHPQTVAVMGSLATCLLQKDDPAVREEAKQVGTKAVELSIRVKGLWHSATANHMATLGCIYLQCEDIKENHEKAAQFLSRAINIHRMGGEGGSLTTGDTMMHLQKAYWALGKFDEADALDAQMLKIFTQHLGPDHESTRTVQAMMNIDYRNTPMPQVVGEGGTGRTEGGKGGKRAGKKGGKRGG